MNDFAVLRRSTFELCLLDHYLIVDGKVTIVTYYFFPPVKKISDLYHPRIPVHYCTPSLTTPLNPGTSSSNPHKRTWLITFFPRVSRRDRMWPGCVRTSTFQPERYRTRYKPHYPTVGINKLPGYARDVER